MVNDKTTNKTKTNIILEIYEHLLNEYGPQGWWPLLEEDSKKGIFCKYHPGDYSIPKNNQQRFEIIIGAILTQNTSWLQVEKALINLKKANLLLPEGILNCDNSLLKKVIRPAGYFNQKGERLKTIALWFSNKKGVPSREELLSIKGVGKETADSILLYAYKVSSFVIDAYTKRMLKSLNLIQGDEKYNEIKELFEKNLPRDYRIYQEYHALIVEHAKRFYKKTNKDNNDFLKEFIKKDSKPLR